MTVKEYVDLIRNQYIIYEFKNGKGKSEPYFCKESIPLSFQDKTVNCVFYRHNSLCDFLSIYVDF